MGSGVRGIVAALALLTGTACGPGVDAGRVTQPAPAPATSASGEPDASAQPEAEHATGHATGHATEPGRLVPLRTGERRLTLTMDTAYTPSAPHDVGTDDYRCFLLDPELDEPVTLTGTNVLPGNPDLVHHVILTRVPPASVARARELDDAEEGEGWTCFGSPGVDVVGNLDDASWLGAWAPGGTEAVHREGYGVRLEPGTQIVMQVHYNLLSGAAADVSATQLRLAGPRADLTELHTMLLPAPVEMPCRPDRDDAPLCDRDAALADVLDRFGSAGNTAALLHLLCGSARPGNVQSCTRPLRAPMTILGVAGHMHLLGRSIEIEVNRGTLEARTVLDIPVWDFDDQGSRRIDPVRLDAGDTVTVTCRHAQGLRDRLPAFETAREDRYVLWGEGTTDEMCLGILQVSRP